ncbi:MAG: hypothetical protein HZB13_17495, partial [Acidobacteria bacterium]|nr:hypothetical protein [Acidobacteriota bacterium]
MRNKLLITASVCGLLWAQAQPPQAQPSQASAASSYKVNLPAGGPLALDSADWGASRSSVRGGAIQLDLHSTLFLKNTSNRRLRGVSLLV